MTKHTFFKDYLKFEKIGRVFVKLRSTLNINLLLTSQFYIIGAPRKFWGKKEAFYYLLKVFI